MVSCFCGSAAMRSYSALNSTFGLPRPSGMARRSTLPQRANIESMQSSIADMKVGTARSQGAGLHHRKFGRRDVAAKKRPPEGGLASTDNIGYGQAPSKPSRKITSPSAE